MEAVGGVSYSACPPDHSLQGTVVERTTVRTGPSGRGNYTLGIKEQLIFPEIVYDMIEQIRGMDITVVTTAKTDEEAKAFLELMGMPFSK